ncbi:MAG: integrase arm-type DNA-binding domain-containing protein, partial [Myxococcales bacterium]|nr:integrase arm-type DNA-binding domain-containing protein [Myxococcales bacterium]
MKGEITETMVKRLRPKRRTYEVTCARLPGFAVRVLPSGKKVFLVRQRIEGSDRRQRIGPHSAELNVDEARRQAMLLLAEPEVAIDPSPRARRETATPKSARRRAAPTRRGEPLQEGPSHTHPAAPRTLAPVDAAASVPATPTVRELADRFLREHVD